MAELIKTLLSFSERAGEIARAIRQEPKLFSLLVEEKGEGEKNQRFAHDFKTLADVLIQEALRHHVARMIPSLAEWVQGEESAEFTNTLGEKITVRICDTQDGTATLLAKVLDGNKEAADILAALAHRDVTFSPDPDLMERVPDLPVEHLGIWIDPVDSTGEYVRGRPSQAKGSIHQQGLQCVTVLIGVFDRRSGLPVAGIINQPFASFNESNKSWEGKAYWGVSYGGTSIHNLASSAPEPPETSLPVVVVSSSEEPALHAKLSRRFTVLHATGAGYKQLVVALGLAAASLSSKGSTFRWDSAAPHGLLRAAGGGVVVYRRLTSLSSDQVSTTCVDSIQVEVSASVTPRRPDALQCGACDPSRCPAIGECHRGITWDVCNCCEVCSKVSVSLCPLRVSQDINEECGGPWEAYGKCGIGLTCLRDARECPYLFNPRGTASDTGSNICDEYLFNAIGRCVQNEQMMHSPHSPFKGNLVKKILEGNRQEMQQENDLTESMVGKRLMLKGVLRGVEY